MELVETLIAESAPRMPPLTTALQQKYGASWTHALAIKAICLDFMDPALAAVGIPGEGAPKAITAGGGSEGACQRIRAGQ